MKQIIAILFLLASCNPAFAQSTAQQIQLGHIVTSGCPGNRTSCWKPYTTLDPMPTTGIGSSSINIGTTTITGGSSGQFLYNNSGVVGGQFIGAQSNQLTLASFGDSNTAPSAFIGQSYPATYVQYLQSYLNLLPNNAAIGGEEACDSTEDVFRYPLPASGTYATYTYMDGINDAENNGTGAPEVNFNNCELAAASWLAIPPAYKVAASASSRTGTWVASSSAYVGSPLISTTNGSTQTYTVTTYGNPIIGWFRNLDGSGGTFSVTVDGGAPSNFTTAPATAIGPTHNGGTAGASPIVFTGIAAGSHTVVVTVTSATNASNGVEVVGFGSYPLTNPSQKTFVVIGGVIKQQNDVKSATTAAYNTDSSTNVTTLSGYGLPVVWADVRAFVNSTTDMANGLHPNATGILHYAQAFQAVMSTLPISVLTPAATSFLPLADLGSTSTGFGSGALGPIRPVGGSSFNTAFGFEALGQQTIVSAVRNTAVGAQALWGNTGNVITNTGGNDNTAVGYQALTGLVAGGSNTFIGASAGGGAINNTISFDTAVGVRALNVTANALNTAVGYQALVLSTSGGNNTGIGGNSCGTLTTGASNTCLGSAVGNATLTTGSSNILIGVTNAITTPASSTSNFLNIGNTLFGTSVNSGTVASPAGSIGIGTATPLSTLHVQGATRTNGVISNGTKFTTSGCSVSATTGGATAGTFTLGANTCTVVITLNGATGLTAPNGWACAASDLTAPTILISQSASSATTASLSVPAGAGATDVVNFSCTAY